MSANVSRWLAPRDWESECEGCAGAGKIDRSEPMHVDGRYMGQDLFREVCDACEGRGFIVHLQDVPGYSDKLASAYQGAWARISNLLAAQEAPAPCGCRVGECESKAGALCRMAVEEAA